MKTYKIVHREELVGWFYVEANSEAEALAEWERKAWGGEVDFSDMELIDSSDEVFLDSANVQDTMLPNEQRPENGS